MQTSINSGNLVRWTKGFDIDDAVGPNFQGFFVDFCLDFGLTLDSIIFSNAMELSYIAHVFNLCHTGKQHVNPKYLNDNLSLFIHVFVVKRGIT